MGGKNMQKEQLRFITCGSVDDGKSTLIGRLLHDSKLLPDDQIEALSTDSASHGTVEDGLDFALLGDGLDAEQEQGITIDVAYRYFATSKRNFIVADTPGHAQYTRNMAAGASTADLAVILLDARKGVVTQTRRHAHISSLFGIRHVILAVNKMDLIDYDQETFDAIRSDFSEFSRHLSFDDIVAIPISARHGDNVTEGSQNMPWYTGPCVVKALESTDAGKARQSTAARLPVQLVSRPNSEQRGYAGTVTSGEFAVGADVVIEPTGVRNTIAGISGSDGQMENACAGDAVTVTLEAEADVGRGSVIRPFDAPMIVTDQVQAHVIWMSSAPLIPGRQYLLRLGTQSASAWVSELKHVVNVNTQEHVAAKTVELNDIAVCNLSFDRRVACDAVEDARNTGSFILIDRFSHETVGAGMVDFSLRRAQNLTVQKLTLDRHARAQSMGQKPFLLWFTGLSGAGKSTVANIVERKLHEAGRRTYLLDGDNVRHGLNRDLGFTDADRVENIRRISEVAKLFVDAGMIVLVSAISPFRSERDTARDLLEDGEFIEIFVDASLETCEERDPKGLYARARSGEIKNFTGIDSPYEPPLAPDLALDTDGLSPEAAADEVIALLERRILDD